MLSLKTPTIVTSKSASNLELRCGKCASTAFNVRMNVVEGQGKVAQVICASCGEVRAFDDEGVLQASGKIEFRQ